MRYIFLCNKKYIYVDTKIYIKASYFQIPTEQCYIHQYLGRQCFGGVQLDHVLSLAFCVVFSVLFVFVLCCVLCLVCLRSVLCSLSCLSSFCVVFSVLFVFVLCCILCLVCLRSVLCSQCCLCCWIFYSWLPLSVLCSVCLWWITLPLK